MENRSSELILGELSKTARWKSHCLYIFQCVYTDIHSLPSKSVPLIVVTFPFPAPFTGITWNSNLSHGLGLGTVNSNSGSYTLQLVVNGVLPAVTLKTSMQYHRSGSTPVMSRENGGVQVRRMDVC